MVLTHSSGSCAAARAGLACWQKLGMEHLWRHLQYSPYMFASPKAQRGSGGFP